MFNGIDLSLISRALQHRNYRLYFYGQGISLIGVWAQRVAVSWLVYRLTGSALMLGVVGFVGDIPAVLAAPIAGVLADRWDRRRLVMLVQSLAMVQAFVLAALVLTEMVAVWHIIVLTLFSGVLTAFEVPTRQSYIVELIERREDLGNAVALNSSLVNGARLLGPSIAGILIATVGEGICFLLNAVSYLAVIGCFVAMQVKPWQRTASVEPILQDFKQGFDYVFGFPPMRSILLLLGLISLMGVPFQILMPVFARDILHGGPSVLGFLMGCSGGGALLGAIYLASRKSVLGLERLIPIATGIFGIGLVAFSLSRTLPVSLALMVVTGFGMISQMASSNTMLQTLAEDSKRGRVLSYYTIAYRGMYPLGSLLAGSLASQIGAPGTLLIGGVCCLIGGALFARQLPAMRQAMQPIFARMGYLSAEGPEISRAAEARVTLEE
jgi:MFS family permease